MAMQTISTGAVRSEERYASVLAVVANMVGHVFRGGAKDSSIAAPIAREQHLRRLSDKEKAELKSYLLGV